MTPSITFTRPLAEMPNAPVRSRSRCRSLASTRSRRATTSRSSLATWALCVSHCLHVTSAVRWSCTDCKASVRLLTTSFKWACWFGAAASPHRRMTTQNSSHVMALVFTLGHSDRTFSTSSPGDTSMPRVRTNAPSVARDSTRGADVSSSRAAAHVSHSAECSAAPCSLPAVPSTASTQPSYCATSRCCAPYKADVCRAVSMWCWSCSSRRASSSLREQIASSFWAMMRRVDASSDSALASRIDAVALALAHCARNAMSRAALSASISTLLVHTALAFERAFVFHSSSSARTVFSSLLCRAVRRSTVLTSSCLSAATDRLWPCEASETRAACSFAFHRLGAASSVALSWALTALSSVLHVLSSSERCARRVRVADRSRRRARTSTSLYIIVMS
eukprot:PhM_4_TR4300/c0_g1_i1/m.60273